MQTKCKLKGEELATEGPFFDEGAKRGMDRRTGIANYEASMA